MSEITPDKRKAESFVLMAKNDLEIVFQMVKFSYSSNMIIRNMNVLDSLRRLRHNINYYAYQATENEANEVIKIAKNNFSYLADKLLEELKK